jgi:hypothetical protein
MRPRFVPCAAARLGPLLGALWGAVLVAGCGGAAAGGGDAQAPANDGGVDAEAPVDATPDRTPATCGTGARPLPAGLTELGWDDAAGSSNLRQETWAITVDGATYPLGAQVLWEAVRFELPHPARVHGFSVQWAGVPDGTDPATELAAGLYPDFGHNGFDFWQWQPLWQGTRCVRDVAAGTFVTYVFDQPLEVAHPGLVYVAHQVTTAQAPVFAFDLTETAGGDCEVWANCHSAMNLPEIGTDIYFGGVSFPFEYDYRVRLHVEYTEELAPAGRIFQPRDFPPHTHAAFGDFDNDGWDDLVTDGPTLYRNHGDGTFTDATAASGIAAMGLAAEGGVWGDYDNDGCLDLFLFAKSYTQADSLLRGHCDGTFTDATAASGIVDYQTYNPCGDPGNTRAPTAAAAWVDFDADGRLDLYLANYNCPANAETGTPESYYRDTVFHNLGNGVFEEWTGAHGFSTAQTPSRGVSPIDHDGDGDVDVYVNNYRLQANFFFENNGDGTFTETAVARGLAGVQHGAYYGHSIGVAWGDLDNDGRFDVVVANLAHPRFFNSSSKTEVLLHDAAGTYHDLGGDWTYPASAAGLRYEEMHAVPALADFDHDGILDLVLTATRDGRPTDFYWGRGDGTFRLDAYHAGITTTNGWGVAVADIDHDGDPDVFATTLFVNTLPPERKGHWLQVRAVGNVAANRAAIGATVRVTADGVTRLRHVQGGTGQGNQDSLYLHFGLGGATSVESVSVVFPGGKLVAFAGPFAADQRLWVFEDGSTHLGWAPP